MEADGEGRWKLTAGATESVLPVGRVYGGRYRLQKLLGRGGMGAVYEVLDERKGECVALKCIHGREGHATRAIERELFGREYRTLAQLSHPAMIQVYDYGISEDGPYYTMELLGGHDLHGVADITWQQLCTYMRDVASCLALLHSRRMIHRDVSPRNIRCIDGQAKLLDFGAMATMGPGREIIGTPPMAPPEVIYRDNLDGRCDLYALGATMYFALTRRHAYPARIPSQLPQLWRSRLVPPSAHNPEIPESLEALILDLLSLNPAGRPRSAAEVMRRLSSIASLDEGEAVHTPLSYLSTPLLQGRQAVLEEANQVLATAATTRHDTSVLWVEGVPGVGRSRILDIITVEGRLGGALVIKLDGLTMGGHPAGFAEELLRRCRSLFAGPVGTNPAPPWSDSDSPHWDSHAAASEKTQAIVGARDAVASLARIGRTIIAVDDVDSLPAPSQQLLAELARSVRRDVVLVLARRSDRQVDSSLRALKVPAHHLELSPLQPLETEALLRSVFGGVPGLKSVSASLHAVGAGLPRATVELAQHLVDTGRARYDMGGWALPARLAHEDLPAAWTHVIDDRILKLPAEERKVLEALAFAADRGLSLDLIDQLTDQTSEGNALAADSLLSCGLLQSPDGSRVVIGGAARERTQALCSEARRREIHAALSTTLKAANADPIDVADCEFLAGRPERGIEILLGQLQAGTRWETAPACYGSVLERALDACVRLERPLRDSYSLRCELLQVGNHMGIANMREHFSVAITQLSAACGLEQLAALPDELSPLERAAQALQRAQVRYDGLPPEERILPPGEALAALALIQRQAAAFGSVSMDYDLLATLPSLKSFAPLSEALLLSVDSATPAAFHLTAARYEEAQACFKRALVRLQEPDRAGLSEEMHQWGICALRFALGHISAGLGQQAALAYASLLEGAPAWTVAAWDVRQAYYQRLGNWDEAEVCRSRVERLRLESDRRPAMVDTSARLELDAAVHAGDLTIARQAAERLPEMIAIHPGYAPYAHFAPAVIALLRDDYPEALTHAEAALEMLEAGRHPSWPWVVHCVLRALLELERYEEVRTRGRLWLAEAEAVGLKVMAHHISVPLALAEGRLGECAQAVARLEAAISHREALGCQGLNLGWAYEHRARLAIWMGDREGFEHYAALCGEQYGKRTGASSLAGKYEKLFGEAQRVGLGVRPPPAADGGTEVVLASRLTSFWTRQIDGAPVTKRLEAGLDLLLGEVGAEAGALFRVAEGRVSCVANSDGLDVGAAESLATVALGEEDDITATDAGETACVQPHDEQGRVWVPVDLGVLSRSGFERSGVAVLVFSRTPTEVPLELIEIMGRLLDAYYRGGGRTRRAGEGARVRKSSGSTSPKN